MAKSQSRPTLIALGAIIGGAVSNNLLDRVRFGAVEDFVHFHVGSFAPFGYFNLADSAISLGAVVLVFESLFTPPTSLKNTP
jgi:signal peptidase II